MDKIVLPADTRSAPTRIFDPASDIWKPSIHYVYMKARRADFHLKSAEMQIGNWIKGNPYSMVEKEDADRTKHFFILTPNPAPEEIALTVGDFVNCLRSALDQLAWNLVNLFPETVPANEHTARGVAFPICDTEAAYLKKRALFHPTIHPTLDSLQPDDRGNAINTHALWELDKLWNIDKHRTIPVNCGSWIIKFAGDTKGWIDFDEFNQCFVVAVPSVSRVCFRPTYVKPYITPDILFGKYMGSFSVSVAQLRAIHEFVTSEVIPRFARFFPQTPV